MVASSSESTVSAQPHAQKDATFPATSALPTPPTTTSRTDVRSKFLERLDDKFDRENVSSELVEALQEKESRSMSRRTAKQETPEVLAIRNALFQVAWLQINQAGYAMSDWFEAARVLDILPQSFIGELMTKPQLLEYKAMALVKVAAALGGESKVGSVGQLRCCQEGLEPKTVALQEQEILKYLDSAPSVATWQQIFMTRLDIVTDGNLRPWKLGLDLLACRMAMNVVGSSNSTDRPPRTLAIGCICLALAAMKLVSLESLLQPPEGADLAGVQAMLQQLLQAMTSGRAPAFPEPRRDFPAVLPLAMEVAIGVSGPEELRAAAAATVGPVARLATAARQQAAMQRQQAYAKMMSAASASGSCAHCAGPADGDAPCATVAAVQL